MNDHFAFMNVYIPRVCKASETEKDAASPGTGVTDGSEPPSWVLGSQRITRVMSALNQ